LCPRFSIEPIVGIPLHFLDAAVRGSRTYSSNSRKDVVFNLPHVRKTLYPYFDQARAEATSLLLDQLDETVELLHQLNA
jgi:hypothetical protein